MSEPHRSSPELGAVPAPSRLRAPRSLFGLSLACRLPIERKMAKSTPTPLRPLFSATSSLFAQIGAEGGASEPYHSNPELRAVPAPVPAPCALPPFFGLSPKWFLKGEKVALN